VSEVRGYGCELDAGRGAWLDFRPERGRFVGGGQVSHFWVVAFPEAAVGRRFVKFAVGTSRLDFVHFAPRFLVLGYWIEDYMIDGGMQGFFCFLERHGLVGVRRGCGGRAKPAS
jgi:hypothetical protein